MDVNAQHLSTSCFFVQAAACGCTQIPVTPGNRNRAALYAVWSNGNMNKACFMVVCIQCKHTLTKKGASVQNIDKVSTVGLVKHNENTERSFFYSFVPPGAAMKLQWQLSLCQHALPMYRAVYMSCFSSLKSFYSHYVNENAKSARLSSLLENVIQYTCI